MPPRRESQPAPRPSAWPAPAPWPGGGPAITAPNAAVPAAQRPSTLPPAKPSAPPAASQSGRSLTSQEPSRGFPAPVLSAPLNVPQIASADAARRLLPYSEAPQVDATHVDRHVEARARAMLSTAVELSAASANADHPEHDIGPEFDLHGVPSFAHAMGLRVRFLGADVPLWSLIMPLVIVVALAAAFAASAASSLAQAAADAKAAALTKASAPSASAVVASAVSASSAAAPVSADTPLPASSFVLRPLSYAEKDVLSFADTRTTRDLARARKLQESLARDPGAIEDAATLSELGRLIDNHATARLALETTANLPAPQAADLLYEIWVGSSERGDTAELARALLFSKDVRPKASNALGAVLDLEIAERCEDDLAILPRLQKDGDRRALRLLLKLQRRYGCGPGKRLDCYPCLRQGSALDDTIKAVRDRKEPKTFGKH